MLQSPQWNTKTKTVLSVTLANVDHGYSDDQIAAIHESALTVLEELGVRVLNDEARERFAAAGAEIDDTQVRLERLVTIPAEYQDRWDTTDKTASTNSSQGLARPCLL